MKVQHSNALCNPTSAETQLERTPQQVAQELKQLAERFQNLLPEAVGTGKSFDEVERTVFQCLLTMGFEAMQLFVALQGAGDVGPQIVTEQEQTLRRSAETARTRIRSIFGEHSFREYTYSPGRNKRIELRGVSSRMQLPATGWSYLLEEFSQIFCVDQAFHQAADNLASVFGGEFSVQTLEHTNQRLGKQADTFLDNLPTPQPKSEGQLLVASADGKGVPLVKTDAAKVAAFETSKKRPGNRRMATVASVYTVDPHQRSAEDVVAALFRDEQPQPKAAPPKRPQPQNKNTTAHFPTSEQDGDVEIPISGIHEAMAWMSDQVDTRRQPQQTLIVHMDGQVSLWDTAQLYFGAKMVEVLDFLHVSLYVWQAAALFSDAHDQREKFTRQRLLKLLRGEVASVIRGLRRLGALHKLKGQKRKDLLRICGYFENNKQRMRYAEYLQAGYPIATGVIEGACRHLVKDRMERTGMRWTLEGARSMLNLRAAFQSDHWKTFHQQRIKTLSDSAHPHRNLIHDYQPLNLAI